jgi:hypothetical protein
MSPELHRLTIPELRRFTIPELRKFRSFWNGQQIHAKKPYSAVIFAHYLKTYFVSLGKLDISRV